MGYTGSALVLLWLSAVAAGCAFLSSNGLVPCILGGIAGGIIGLMLCTWAGGRILVMRSRMLAETGDAKTQCSVGNMFYNGTFVRKDLGEAAEWFRRSAEKGCPEAELRLGLMYFEGEGVEQSFARASELIETAVSQGSADAVKIWADLKDYVSLGKSAEEGDAEAEKSIGMMCLVGNSHGFTPEHAVKWLMSAAEHGSADAMMVLGRLSGSAGEPGDGADGAEWYRKAAGQYRKAAENGDAEAQHILSEMYECGYGVEKDEAEAVKWLMKSAGNGRADAQFTLGTRYESGLGVRQDREEAVRLYRAAADQGLAAAQRFLGDMYEGGNGVQQSSAEAAIWYRKAAEQGDRKSQECLARMYREGRGVAQDDAEAEKWMGMKAPEAAHEHEDEDENEKELPGIIRFAITEFFVIKTLLRL